FAFLPRFWTKGYALESASAVMSYGRSALGLSRIVAIVSQDNHRSARLLENLGFRLESSVSLQPDGDELKLYAAAPLLLWRAASRFRLYRQIRVLASPLWYSCSGTKNLYYRC